MTPAEERPVPIYHHPDYEGDTQIRGHPECPERVKAILKKIKDLKLPVEFRTPDPADVAQLRMVHSSAHIDRIRDFGVGFMDPDTFHHERTYDMALRAAGGSISAVLASYEEKRPTFTFPRPPGHHAGYDYNMGFCYFNNLAIAAKVLMKKHPEIERIAIVDIDAHHGNGTNDIFQSDPDVLYISAHQWGIFPGTGHEREVGYGSGEGRLVNLPFRGGTGDHTYELAWGEVIEPLLDQFKPRMILVSIGADGHLMDPLTGLTLSSGGYRILTKGLMRSANRLVDGRISFTLEGGYHLPALAETVADAVNTAAGYPVDVKLNYTETREMGSDKGRIRDLKEIQSSYWKL